MYPAISDALNFCISPAHTNHTLPGNICLIFALRNKIIEWHIFIICENHICIHFLQAIAGEIGMDNVLDNIANSLFNGLLPNDWRKLAPATCKQLGSWMEHLQVSYERIRLLHIHLQTPMHAYICLSASAFHLCFIHNCLYLLFILYFIFPPLLEAAVAAEVKRRCAADCC